MGNILGDNFYGGDLGVTKIIYDSVDLGLTFGNTILRKVENPKEIFAAQYGIAPIDLINNGEWWELEFDMEDMGYTKLEKVISGVTVSGAGTAIKFGNGTFISRYTNAKVLQIKRVDSDGAVTTDANYIWTAPKAAIKDIGEWMYGPDEQKIYHVIMHIFFDRTNLYHGYAGAASSLGL
jgi:hypothetical protein